MATNHISVEALTDHIMNSDSSSCKESEDEMEQLTTDDPAPVSDCTLLDSASTSSHVSTSGSSVNSLSRLHRPTSSELSRKRVIDRNPLKGPNRSSDPKSVTPEQRLKDSRYANECFTISMGKLFCRAYREELSVKSSVINNQNIFSLATAAHFHFISFLNHSILMPQV